MIQVDPAVPTGEVVRFRLARALLGQQVYRTAAYWVDGTLVDTGCAHTSGELCAALREFEVDRVVNTHSHEDHIGANAAVQEISGCPIQAHPGALPVIQDPRLQPLQLYRRVLWGWPRPSRPEPIESWIETRSLGLQVIHTPGHSADHVCLLEPEQGWLFSGDAYIGGHDRALRKDYDIYGIIASLDKLAALPVHTIFSGSGSVRTDGASELRRKVNYLEELGERIRSLAGQGLSNRAIRRKILGPESSMAYLTLGHFAGRHLISSYLE
jgi:glyoxylase-like metal-dependent hydrolase (beta-lactamase superfamily II)